MERLTSLKNPKVQLWRSLKERRARRDTGLFVAEGFKLTEEALASGWPIAALLLREGEACPALPESVPVYELPEHILAAVCDTRTPQGIAAVVRIPEESDAPVRGLWVALDNVQDPGNVGTILRTADAAGFQGALLSADCADLFSPKVLRATMGSLFHLPVRIVADLAAQLTELRAEGFSVLSSELGGTPFYDRRDVSPDAVLVIGNEGNGVSPAVRAAATHHLSLPMRGRAESLNASVAAGIMMYELTKEY